MSFATPRFLLFNPRAAQSLRTIGRSFFGFSTAAFGIAQLVRADFVRLVPDLPTWLPGPPSIWAAATGALLLVIGGMILVGKHLRLTTAVLAGLIMISFVFLHVPEIASDPARGFKWTNPCKALALLGGSMLIAGSGRALLSWSPRLFFGAFLIICGIQHFVYADFVTQLVPTWLPSRPFWTYFTGVALLAGGVGVLVPLVARWAAALSGLMIFSWAFLLHLPRAFGDVDAPGELDGVFEALALAGVALLLASQPLVSRASALESSSPGEFKIAGGFPKH